jgi:RimJ/RimL family protein N-acetyltransferase
VSEVTLRSYLPTDLPILFAFQLDPEATAMADFPSRDEEAFAAHWAKILADPTTRNSIVEVDGEVAGSLGAWPADGRRYVGYWFGRAFWGRGVATAALRAFVAEVDERPLYAYVAVGNVASQRVLEKCGFVPIERDEAEILYELGSPGSTARTSSSTSSLSAT